MQRKNLLTFLLEKKSPLNKLNRLKKYLYREYLKPSFFKLDPIKLQVELTNKCNFNCKTCARHWVTFKLGDMNDELVNKIKEILPKISELVLFGYGESLLHPRFFDLIKEANKQKKRVSFFTNGALINTRRAYELVKNNVTTITFSIDAASATTFKLLRGKKHFIRVISAINFINRYKKEFHSEYPTLEINFVLTKQNLIELPSLVFLASKLGIRRIECSYLIIWSEKLKQYSPYTIDFTPFIDEAKKIAKKHNIILDLPHTTGRRLQCDSPWKYSYIRWDGIVQACCFSDKLKMGDLNKQDFQEIWNNQKYKQLRKNIKKKKYPIEDCKTCIARFKNLKLKNLEDLYIKITKREKY